MLPYMKSPAAVVGKMVDRCGGHPSHSTQTAGIIIIGDEILKGHTKDTNSCFLLQRLWSLGVKVGKVSVIPDDVETIAREVKQFAEQFSFVLTTGGIGPTHDDVTMAGIAKAFGDDLVHNHELETLIRQAYRDEEINAAHLKMVQVPKCAKLVYGVDKTSKKKSRFPIIAVCNVYVFPGVPRLLEKYFDMLESSLVPNKKQFFLHKVYLSVDETEVASILDEVDLSFRESVHLGSYPNFSGTGFQVKVTLESECQDKLRKAWEFLLSKLPKEFILKAEGDCDKSSDDGEGLNSFSPVDVKTIYSVLDPKDESNLSACVKGAWAIIQETLQLYSLDQLCISFNGGKDCTMLLHIMHAAVHKLSLPSTQLNAVYVQCNSPFPEVEAFVKETVSSYRLNLITLSGNIKDALGKLKNSHPNIRAIMMGTRKHDPFSGTLHNFSPTDPGWPQYMRINPILDWNHGDVWHVLRECHVPYCSLYDQGYTSLGSQHNTKPNPALKTEDGDEWSYKPAYLLEDGNLERAGRF